ncbi:DDE-type integrase/transposase/recombinase [uncultured Sneathia sp.]|uniref:DDE-type integrase/transposase/recombinase n=1 Tax=uncultured Sneathia sp. TaxID=278067 RepID=UPI002599CA71|nr:DDE-type integrase/transposase/recombinase [uncultured Sneathia sp.]
MHTKTQKRCKLCLKTFIFSEPNKFNISNLSNESLKFYCPYRIKTKNEIIKEHGKLNPRDKISYIYRDIKISLNNVFKFIDSSKSTIPKNNFKFRNFNSQIFSKVIYFKVNLKLSNRDTALAMKDLYGINISHTTINTYCNMASSLVYSINSTKTDNISNQIVGDETYIKVKGKKHYIWILYDLKYENIVAYHISEKRDFNACATVFLKLIEKYEEKPKELFVMSDKYTSYCR